MKKLELLLFAALLPFSTLADLNSGLVAFYTFDGTESNSAGPGLNLTNHGVTYQAGLHGLAAWFDGSDQYFSTSENFPVTNNTSRSISVWLNPSNIPGLYGNVLGWGLHWSGNGTCWDLHLLPPGLGQAWINAANRVYSSGPSPFTYSYGQWIHLAMTWQTNSDTATFYLNGTNVGGYLRLPGGPVNTQPGPLLVGYFHTGYPPNTEWATPYVGLIEDLRIYSRVLSPLEVAILAGANSAPVIAAQPQGTVAYWGGSVNFSVDAEGSPEPSYLWYKDGVAIPWATNSTLSLASVDFSDAGGYTVVVSNSEGSVTSAPPALLVVNPAGVSIGLYPFLTIEGTVGKIFGIQYTTAVSQTNSWITLTNLTLTQPVEVWIDTSVDVSPGHDPTRFYRVVAIPSP